MDFRRLFRNLSYVAVASVGLLAAFSTPARAVPAKPGLIKYDNNGKPLEVYLRGDERSHYFVSKDGYMLYRDDKGTFRYALPEGDHITLSDIPASEPGSRTAEEDALLASFPKDAPFEIFNKETAIKRSRAKSPAKVADEAQLCTFPTKGSPRCLAILVEFQDMEFSLADPRNLFSRMLNEEGFSEYGASGSISDYFRASSNDQFTPQFDVYGPVKLPYNMSYYGSNDPLTGDDARPYEMIPHAVDLLAEQIDFSVYDNDNDGVVDNIYIFYAGYGEADGGPANSIWPHSWNIHDDLGLEIYMNGKLLNHYATSNELSDGQGTKLAGIGVFCHEFSHVMGLPDLYSTLYTGAFTPSEWSLMDHGSYNNGSHTPPYHTGYERYCLGWIEPKVLSDPKNVTMFSVSQTGAYGDVYMIPTPSRQEYYILENRQQKGWDEYIPGHGLLVWHIDFDPQMWVLNIVNIEKQYVDIVEADNIKTEFTRAGDTFPGTVNVTEFTDDSTPSMKTWTGLPLHSPLTDIKDIGGVVSFAFKGGENIFDDVVALAADDVKAGGFTAKWTPIQKATGYLLSVYEKEQTSEGIVKKYAEGFMKREIGNFESFEVSGLTPSTTYYYTVTATNGRFYSADSNEVEVMTLAPTLDYKTVALLEPTDVTESSFTANWQKLEDADTYEITLYELALGDPFLSKADFTDKLLPDGWQTDASFDGRASYAVEIPSLRMSADGAYVTTAQLESGIRSLSFWYRAASTLKDGILQIDGFTGGSWQPITSIDDLVSTSGGATVELTEIPLQTTRIRISLHTEAGGSVSIDDIVVGYGGNVDFQPLKSMTDINVGDVSSYSFLGLGSEKDYGYSVSAINANFRSLPSGIQRVHTSPAGIHDAFAEGLQIRVNGRKIEILSAVKAGVKVFDISGQMIAQAVGSQTAVTVPESGLYLITTQGKTYKVIVK